MKVTGLLSAAYSIAMASDQELHKKWISVAIKVANAAGPVHRIAVQRIGRLDMMLRLLESERLETMQAEPSIEPEWSLDLQISLSENWLLSSYEVARAMKEQLKRRGDDMFKLVALEHRLALVRMPVAKGEIQGMNLKANLGNPPLLVKVGDVEGEPYQADGSYMMPGGLCGETGAAMWCPVDITSRQMVDICRRDLSDEMLALFD